MNKRILCLAFLATLGAAATARADVLVEKAWVRATPGQMRISAGYAHISNTGQKADRLLRVAMPGAGRIEIHHTSRADGMMSMDAVDALAVPAQQAIDLSPGGYHLMIMDLSHPLKAGDTVDLSFTFAEKGDVTVKATVAPLSATQSP